jgi:hypothetical protein
MSEARRTWVSQFLIGLGLLVGFLASIVGRLALVHNPASVTGEYAIALSLAGFGVALVGARIGNKARMTEKRIPRPRDPLALAKPIGGIATD